MISHEIPSVKYLIGKVNALRMLLSNELMIQNPTPSAQKITSVSL